MIAATALVHPTQSSRAVERVIDLVAREYHVSKVLLTNQSRCRSSVAKARQIAMYLSHVVLGRTLSDVGSAFGRDRTTVSYACHNVEDWRDDLDFDAQLDRLEAVLLGENADA